MTYQLFIGNNLEILPTLPDNSIDSIVTDPPYGLSDNKYVADTIARWIAGERDFVPDGKGFMGKAWDAFVPPPALWDECLRVLKPGGHLLAFFGSRTQDIGALAIRLAGFEIRDSIAWLYGSGFPKSMDISKAIDKKRNDSDDIIAVSKKMKEALAKSGKSKSQLDEMFETKNVAQYWFSPERNPQIVPANRWPVVKQWLGVDDSLDAEVWRLNGMKGQPGESWGQREVIGSKIINGSEGSAGGFANGIASLTQREPLMQREIDITAPSTPEAQQWQGWGTALKPALEPIVVARKPLSEGTVANNVLKWGTGGLNIDGSRIGTGTGEKKTVNYPDIRGDNYQQGKESYAERGTVEREVVDQGRWPANIILSHTELCNPTGQTLKNKTSAGKRTATFGTQDTQSGGDGSGGWSGYEYETEVYECVEGCPVKLLDEQSGTSKSTRSELTSNPGTVYGAGKGLPSHTGIYGHNDSGGASRFFYVAKASKRDRNEGLDELEETRHSDRELDDGVGGDNPRNRTNQAKQNFHPTVKPTALMEYLVKLVTPPNGTVLDPFTGSGSTGKAAILQGFNFIGIEMTEEYVPIIEGRLKHAEAKVAEAKENIEAQPQGLF